MSLRNYDAKNAVQHKFAAIDTNDTRPYLYLHGKHSNENPAVTGKFLPREALNEINLEINEKQSLVIHLILNLPARYQK